VLPSHLRPFQLQQQHQQLIRQRKLRELSRSNADVCDAAAGSNGHVRTTDYGFIDSPVQRDIPPANLYGGMEKEQISFVNQCQRHFFQLMQFVPCSLRVKSHLLPPTSALRHLERRRACLTL